MTRQYWTILETALKLGVSDKTVRRHIKAGKLKAFMAGREYRISSQAIRDYLKPVQPQEAEH
jgi:excisionase family DNA binding protein